MFTPLHAALGLEPGIDLTFDHVEQAIAEEVRESGELDWKRDLPLPGGPSQAKAEQMQELAKDLAAMANSGGGMLVYGVAEKKHDGVSVAAEIHPVGSVTEDQEKRIRQVATSRISPPLMGLRLLNLAPFDDPAHGVLAVVVPDSPDRPHLVPRTGSDQFWFVAPRRNGSHTEAMTEYELATAYRQREQSRRSAERDLQELFDQFADGAGARVDGRGPWVLAVARPATPLRRNRLTYEQGQQMLIGSVSVSQPSMSPFTLTHGQGLNRGLRTFYVAASRKPNGGLQDPTVAARIQVFDDGSVAVGMRRGGEGNNVLGGGVAIADIQMVAFDLFVLVSRALDLLGMASDYQARLDVRPRTEVFLHHQDGLGGALRGFNPADRRPGYREVDGVILSSEGRQAAAESWLDVVVDAVEQAGGKIGLTHEHLLQSGSARTPSQTHQREGITL